MTSLLLSGLVVLSVFNAGVFAGFVLIARLRAGVNAQAPRAARNDFPDEPYPRAWE